MTIQQTDAFVDAQLAAKNTALAGGTKNFFSDSGRTSLLLSIPLHASAPLTDEGTENQYQINRDTGVFTGHTPTPTGTGTAISFNLESSSGVEMMHGTVSGLAGDGDYKIPEPDMVAGVAIPAETWGTEPVLNIP